MKEGVTVIIPCYNAMDYLKETLQSVFNQTFTNLDVVVIDDGSTDGSFEYLQQLNNEHLYVVKNKAKGACVARNYGLELAKGEYIQFLDADDLLSPTKIESQIALLQQFPDRIAVCSTMHFYNNPENGKIVDRDFMFSTNQPEDFLLQLYGGDGEHHNMVQTSAWLTPKSILNKAGKWDESLSKDQDGEFFCRVVMTSEGVCYAPNVLNYYRKHLKGNNVSSGKTEKHLQSQLKALESKKQQLNNFSNTQAYKNAFALQYKLLAINAYPQFKDIYKTSIEKSKQLGNSKHLPVLGGRMIEGIKLLLGWRVAKKISYLVHKVI